MSRTIKHQHEIQLLIIRQCLVQVGQASAIGAHRLYSQHYHKRWDDGKAHSDYAAIASLEVESLLAINNADGIT